uniref:Uncharacterized protein n=1 Tax=Avena sativa TaxID=4498 RepID=A0ACD5UW80_AVESA
MLLQLAASGRFPGGAAGGRAPAGDLVVAVAVPIFLLVRFHGHPMSQVWILSLSICSYVAFFLMFIWRSRPFYTELFRLSYGPLLAFCCASAISSATATFVLLFSIVWAAGTFGYSLALHNLRSKGTKPAIHAEPSPFCPTKDNVKQLNNTLYVGAFAVLVWTLAVACFLNSVGLTEELYILMVLVYSTSIHAALWLIIVILLPINGTSDEGLVVSLIPAVCTWMLLSPVLCVISQIFAAVCNLLLMVALVAFLWYNLAFYMHFLATATSRDSIHIFQKKLPSLVLPIFQSL